ncbi:MAG: cupin domain-containing protein [Acidobacteriota bacterium]
MNAYTFVDNAHLAIAIPADGLTKQLLLQAAHVRVLGLGFAAGHLLKEHTAPVDVMLHFVEGEAEVTLGGDHKQVRAGSLIHIPARLQHSVRAVTPVKMLLVMFPDESAATP